MSSTAERITYPPLVAHGPDNNGAIVVVITYSFMFITILFAILRSYSSYMQKRELSWDDITFSVAVVRNTAFCLQYTDRGLIFCLLQLLIIPESILTERAVGQGLGQHIAAISTSNLASYYKVCL